jgi:hypothetical protein
LLAEPDLTRSWIANLNFFPVKDLGPAGLVNPDSVNHVAPLRLLENKEKPRRGSAGRGRSSDPVGA